MSGTIIDPALEENDTTLLFVVPFGIWAGVVFDPDQPRVRAKKHAPAAPTPTISDRLRRYLELRAPIQRDFKGGKARNLRSYRTYIEDVTEGRILGGVPVMTCWSPDPLPLVRERGSAVRLTIPDDAVIVPIDGETQLAARFDLLANQQWGSRMQVKIILYHGTSAEHAAQVFADLNSLGVNVTKGEAAMRDTRDPVLKLARDLGTKILGHHYGQNASQLSVHNLAQAIYWLVAHRLSAGAQGQGSNRFVIEERIEYFVERCRLLRPLMDQHRALRRAAIFIAFTDARVTAEDIRIADWNDWETTRADMRAAHIERLVAKLRRETIDFGTTFDAAQAVMQ